MHQFSAPIFCDKCPSLALAWFGDQILCIDCIVEHLPAVLEANTLVEMKALTLSPLDLEYRRFVSRSQYKAA